jgi:truncated hemoglobin YjbI
MSAPSTNGLRWDIISKPIFLGCIAATLFGSILWSKSRENRNPKTIHQNEKNRKLVRDGFVSESNDVDLKAVHEFYNAVQEDPLLYPYFMDVKKDKREGVMRNIACMFHKTLEKQFTTADSLKLQNIHRNLHITDIAYDRFTKLFAHICCKGKSNKLRARMFKSFTRLKSDVCSTRGKLPADLAEFFELLTDSKGCSCDLYSKVEKKHKAHETRVLNKLNTNLHKFSFPRDSAQSLVLDRAKAWNNRATHEQLKKKINKLEDKINILAKLNDELDSRIKVMEPMSPLESQKANFFVTTQKETNSKNCDIN